MIVKMCFGQSTPYYTGYEKIDKEQEKKDGVLNIIDMNKEETNKLSQLKTDINLYDIMKDTIEKTTHLGGNGYKSTNEDTYGYIRMALTGDGYKAIEDFINDNKELKDTLDSVRKQIQNEKNDKLCEAVYHSKYPRDNEAREIKKELMSVIETVFQGNFLKDIRENLDDMDFIGFETKIEWNKKENKVYDENKNEYCGTGTYHIDKNIYVYPTIDYPDDKAKEFITKALDRMQNVVNDYMQKKSDLFQKQADERHQLGIKEDDYER